jgi:hypothetical protein
MNKPSKKSKNKDLPAEKEKLAVQKQQYLKHSDFLIPSSSVAQVKENLQKLAAACVLVNQQEVKVKVPDFDKPQYGELFQQESSFEYVVKDINLKNAEEEIQNWNIKNVSFVTDDE